jgi:adenine-specific DNA-methyltransferase
LSRSGGRLELTWANKDMRLLTHGADTYEWVDPHDWRVSEVRLLEHLDIVGDAGSGNLLVEGDALHALTSLTSLPGLAEHYLGQVKLCYIDPPFNTGQTFQHYDDAVEHSVWLTMLRDRLAQVRRLLRPDGSVWVHLDDAEQHRARCVLDEVFGAENFVATVVWEKADSPRNSARHLSVDQDYIHVYAQDKTTWRPNRLPRTEAGDAIYKNPDDDPRGPWLPGDPFAGKPYSLGSYEVVGPTGRRFTPPAGRFWRVSLERLQELDADNRVWWGPNGDARPSIKRYLSEVGDLVPRTLWRHSEVGSNRTSSAEVRRLFDGAVSFSTPKPEALIERVLRVGTNPGDLVLDCFAGSGSTAAVAHKMGRRWVTVEVLSETLSTFIRPRLEQVVAGTDSGGVTAVAEWSGGGGFDVARVAPSMFEEDEGNVFLAEWAVGGALADAVRAQLGFTPAGPAPFVGEKGRARLAVVDGMATEGVVRLLVDQLPESTTLTIVAQALEPGLEDLVRELRPGSRVRKVPRDLATTGQLGSRLVRLGAKEPA